MKYTVLEVQRALDKIKEHGGPTEVDIGLDPMSRLVLSYTDTFGGDNVTITIYETAVNKMATITRTTRL